LWTERVLKGWVSFSLLFVVLMEDEYVDMGCELKGSEGIIGKMGEERVGQQTGCLAFEAAEQTVLRTVQVIMPR
jgi:hypothetical protein